MKVEPEYNQDNILIGYSFHCPGCGHLHIFYTNLNAYRIAWTFNGDVNNPTFSPSLLNRTGSLADPNFKDPEGIPPTRCHLFVKEGKIEYCGDCTHALSGKTVEMEDIANG